MKIEVCVTGSPNELFNFQEFLHQGPVSMSMTEVGKFQMDFGDRVMMSDSPVKISLRLSTQ